MKGKIRVLAYYGGAPLGYIKSISYKKESYMLTRDRAFAKTYSQIDSAMSDIDYATRFRKNCNIVFMLA